MDRSSPVGPTLCVNRRLGLIKAERRPVGHFLSLSSVARSPAP